MKTSPCCFPRRAFLWSLIAGVPPLAAQVPYPCSWSGGNGGDWISVAWAPQPLDYIEEAGIPIPLPTWPDNDRAAGSGTFTYLVTVPNGRVNLGSGSVTVATLVVGSGAETRLRSASLRVEGYAGYGGSAVSNEGLISLGNGATLTSVTGLLPSGLTVNGGGTVSLLDEDSTVEGSVLDFGGGQLVRGAGRVGTGIGIGVPSTVINRGTFLADAPPLAMSVQGAAFENRGTARALGGGLLKVRSLLTDNRSLIESDGGVVDFQDEDVDNSGTMRAKSGGILQFKDQQVDNGGGVVEAVDLNSLVQLRGGVTLNGGILRRTAPAQVRLQTGTNTFTGSMLVQGQVEVDATAGLRMQSLTMTGEPGTVLNPQSGAVIYSAGPVDLRGQFDGNGLWSFNAPLSLTGPLTLNNLQFDVGPGQPVNASGTVTNNSVVRLLDGPGAPDTRLLISGATTFTGTGQLRFATGNVNRLDPAAPGAVFSNAAPHTVTTESGGNAVVTAGYVNGGTTEAAGAGSAMLIHNPSLTNTGLIQARDGGFLRINNAVGGTANYVFNNTGGTFRISAGSTAQFESNVLLRGGTVDGPGTLNLTGGTIFDSLPANPISISNTNIVINEFQPFTVRGDLNNGGTLRLNDGTLFPNGVQGTAAVTIDGNVAFNGNGRILFSTPNSNFINSASGTPTLTIGAAQTVASAPGGRGIIYPATVNAGLIEAVGPVVAGGFANVELVMPAITNTGVISSRDGGFLYFNGNSQVIQNAGGFLRAGQGTAFVFSNNATVAGGTLDGTGAFSVNLVTLDGTASPVTVAAPLSIAPGQMFWRGGITNNSVVSISGPNASGAIVRTLPEGVTVGGTGVIRFGTAGNNTLTGPATDVTAPFRLLPGATISTAPGAIGNLNGLILTNEGQIEARGAGGRLNFNPSGFTNMGVVEAVDGGVMNYSVTNTANAGGVLRAGSGASFVLAADGVIHGGTLDGTGAFAVSLARLDGSVSPVTVATQLSLAPGQLFLRGAITNNAVISLAGPGVTGGVIRADANGAVVGGGGVIRFDTPGNNILTSHFTNNTSPFRLLAGARISTLPGARASINGLVFTNEGTVESRGSGAAIDYTGNATNNGLFAAAAGGTLAFNGGNGAFAIENAGGTLRVEAGSAVALNSGIEIRGGLLDGAGTVTANEGRLNGTVNPVTNATTVRSVASGLTVRGAIVNNGNLLSSHTSQTSVNVSGPVTISGNGAITFGGPGFSYWRGQVAADTLTLGTGQTVTTLPGAQGRIEGLALTASGVIEARGASSVLDLFTARGVTNQGVIRSAGGTLNLGAGAATYTFENAGGTIRNEAGTVVLNATVRGGLLEGPGQILSTFAVLDGLGSPVNNAAVVRTFNGGLTLRGAIVNTGTLLSQHVGQTVRVEGPVSLSGTGLMTFGSSTYSYLQGLAAADVLTLGPGQTMTTSPGAQGRAQGLSIVNSGVMESRGNSSILDLFAERGLTNNGLIRASDGATLYLGAGAGSYAVNNAGGTIRSESGGLVLNATVRGGRLDGPAQILSTFAVLDGAANPVSNFTTVRTYNGGMTLRGSFINNGTLLSQHPGQTVRVEGPVDLSGNGAVAFGSTAYSYLQGAAPADVLTLGTGQVMTTSPGALGRAQSLSINNAGTIEARGASAVLDVFAAPGVTNTGIIRAADGGTLNLGAGSGSYTVNNAGGIVRNESGGLVLTATLRGGRIEGPGGVYFYDAVLDGTANPLEIAPGAAVGTNNGAVVIRGQVTNNGRIQLNRTSGLARLLIAESLTLQGSGEVNFGTFAGGAANIIGQSVGGAALTNGSNHTIRVPSGFDGSIQTGAFVNSGTVVVDGTLYGQTTAFTNGPTGFIRGNGTLQMTPVLGNQGTIAPGASPGTLTVSGSVTNSASAVLELEIGGITAGSNFDRLNVTGAFARGGTLKPKLINGFRPQPTDSFLVLSAGSLTGAWANVISGKVVFEQGMFDVVVTATTVTLTNFSKNLTYVAYDNWMDGFPALTGSAREPGADPDGDGFTNEAEFGLGTNPSVPNGVPSTLRGYIYSPTGRYRVEFPRRRAEPGMQFPILSYELQFSSDLVNWETHTGPAVSTVNLDALFELVVFEDSQGTPAHQRRYARVIIKLVPYPMI